MTLVPYYNWRTSQIEWADDQQQAGGQQGQQQQGGGIAGAAGNIGGMAAGRYVGNRIFGGGSAAASAPIASNAASSPLTSALGGIPVGTAADGSTLTTMSPEVIPGAGAPGLGFAPYAGVGAAALGAYGLNKAIKSGNVKSGALSGASLLGGLGAAAPLVGFGPVGWAGLGALALGGALAGGGATKLLHHESTRDFARKNTEDLFSQGKDNQAWQNYVAGMREQYNSAPPDPDKPFFNGKYSTWKEYKAAGLDAGDLSGVLGNMQTFGPDWAGYTDDQRKKITQGLIDADLYKNKKGEVVVTDQDRARQIRDQILGGATT